jgi:hypothetical protein
LHTAASRCDHKVIEYILSKMDTNLINLGKDGHTALYFATTGVASDQKNAELIFNKMSIDAIRKTLDASEVHMKMSAKAIISLIESNIISCDQAIKDNYNDFKQHTKKGDMLSILNKQDEAKECYEAAVKVKINLQQIEYESSQSIVNDNVFDNVADYSYDSLLLGDIEQDHSSGGGIF